MFTGIVREIGTVVRVERSDGVVRLCVAAPKAASRIQLLESVSVSGVCLSVVEVRDGRLVFDVIHETQRLTTLGGLRAGARVHIEPSLAITDRLNGHLVFGHVDALGTVVGRRQRPGELILEIQVEARLRRFLVPKGPIAVDGVSLTVGERIGSRTFHVHLIPETLRQTMLLERRVGERVNLELDYFAKLVAQLVNKRWKLSRAVC